MMRKIKNIYAALLATLLFMIAMGANAQALDYEALKEKVYIQTSHVFFKPGENIFFKIYIVNAATQRPSFTSKVVYAELVNPSGNVVSRMSYPVQYGAAEGSFDFTESMPGGIYKIRAYTAWMQNEKEQTWFTKEITVQAVLTPRILMKLDFPSKGYGAGDQVSADFTLRDLSDLPIRFQKAVFTVSTAGVAIQKVPFTTDERGKAILQFNLPENLQSNDGLLNVTVNYDGYTESISRSIPIVLGKIDLQFMPEGGQMIEGLAGTVAFKAVNEFGKPSDIKGEILDDMNKRVANIESYHDGMGSFEMVPESGRHYHAKITSPSNISRQYDLPVAAVNGFSLHLQKVNGEISITVRSRTSTTLKLTGSSRETPYLEKELEIHAGENSWTFDEKNFPVGISRFTLLQQDVPVAERIMFLNEAKNLQVSIATDKKRYQPREKVKLTLRTTDEDGNPVPSNLSLAVMDDKLWTLADDKQDHILSWLLMSSELHGKVEEPQFYFKKDEPRAIPALDLVMLTNGYRYFDFIDYVLAEHRLKFLPDQENILAGQVTNVKGEPIEADIFVINAVTQDNAIHYRTGADGHFFFSELSPGVKYYLMAQAANRKDFTKIIVQQNGIGSNTMPPLQLTALKSKKDESGLPVKIVAVEKRGEAKQREMENVEGIRGQLFGKAQGLQEVVVMGYSAQRKELMNAALTVRADNINAARSLNSLLGGRVAGLQIVTNTNPLLPPVIKIRGMGTVAAAQNPLIIVDGMLLSDFNPGLLNPADISSVIILKDAAATNLYGAKAANGAIIIETKSFKTPRILIALNHPYQFTTMQVVAGGRNYAASRHFYAPVYNSTSTDERTDFRETIYWNPTVQTDRNGKAAIEFYNSDATTTFRAIAEGISYNGKAGRAEATYSAQSILSVDAKIPPYLTVGDRALLPLVIKNNSNDAAAVSIKVELPEGIKVESYPAALLIKPDSAVQVSIAIVATKAVKGVLKFHIKNDESQETLALPVAVNDKGFPVVVTMSGRKSAAHRFNISKPIPGSTRINLKLFHSPEGQLLDGIESMLREPGGCFEQTSSSLYPNIYILKYLRASGKLNKAVEEKAMGYISRGYQRLLGFETSANGFEWFGRAPAHEALTAYGLLEFTDMSEFIKVDKQMMQRTKDFLLRRRDGKGAFTLNSRGLDAFASVPSKIANVYIVYALTQAGIGKEIEKEYNYAVQQALQSNDGYQLSMMALAASNMKNDADFKLLIEKAGDSYRKTALSSETSVVNSRDASLEVETRSLFALALMREKNPRLQLVEALIDTILSKKSYYGYGATQATILALQAIVEYSKWMGTSSATSIVSFRINGEKAELVQDRSIEFNREINSFDVDYADQSIPVPYSFEVAYHTYTPPSSDKAVLSLHTQLSDSVSKVGETVRMTIAVTNTQSILQPMSIVKIGIPAGLSAQPWQLKELIDKKQVDYYEIFDNYLVLYWMGFKGNETKTIQLDCKAEIAGTYQGKASATYLYYTPEHRYWNDGVEVRIEEGSGVR